MSEWTRNWTDRVVHEWTQHVVPLQEQFAGLNVLEIGVFEGRTARWLLENVANRSQKR